jgi:hypothetical protein
MAPALRRGGCVLMVAHGHSMPAPGQYLNAIPDDAAGQ